MNLYNTDKYKLKLKSLEEAYDKRKITKTKELKNWSDYEQKDYKFIVNEYSDEDSKYWNLCELVVYKNDEIITTLKTNYSHVNIYYVEYEGKDYLFTNEDYQGFTILNLTDNTKYTYIPSIASLGAGWCTTEFYDFDEDDCILTAHGCVWGCEETGRQYFLESLDDPNFENYESYELD